MITQKYSMMTVVSNTIIIYLKVNTVDFKISHYKKKYATIGDGCQLN